MNNNHVHNHVHIHAHIHIANTKVDSLLELFNVSPILAHAVIKHPAKYSIAIKEAIQTAQHVIFGSLSTSLTDPTPSTYTIKPYVNPRLFNLPISLHQTFFSRIPRLSVQNRLIALYGTIIRVGQTRMIEDYKRFECTRCRKLFKQKADITLLGQVTKPPYCDAIIQGQQCMNTKFHDLTTTSVSEAGTGIECSDYQEIRLQESTGKLEIGAVPHSITVILLNDLVDACQVGDDVTIVGDLRTRWKALKPGMRCEMEMIFVASSVTVSNGRDVYNDCLASSETINQFNVFWNQHKKATGPTVKGRDFVVKSFCPQIYGLFLVKLAVLLTLVGGSDYFPSEHDNEHGLGSQEIRKTRKEGHLLLVGDPGTAKSQFLLAASKLSTRSVVTTGSGSTTAGLTVAAVKEGGDWVLEAGALVLADRGVCCIDEFNALRQHDRTAIHEAMEQQTLSVAKAGLVCKLKTRCSVIAACNSKGKFEEGETISANTALASPLLSRFDLILVLLDKKDQEWDRKLSDSILEHTLRSNKSVNISKLLAAGLGKGRLEKNLPEYWSFSTLKLYIQIVRNRFTPRMSTIARIVIAKYYQRQRNSDIRDAARTTVRLLESLIRLAQAHAKLVWRDVVELEDVVSAIILMEASLCSVPILSRTRPDLYADNFYPAATSDASTDPDKEMERLGTELLQNLAINPAVFELQPDNIPTIIRPLELDMEAEMILSSFVSSQKPK